VGIPGHEVIADRFNTIPQAMLTLFELMAEPDLGAYRDVMPEYPLLAFFLIFYVMFGSFGMIALLTGVISESMFEKNQVRMVEERQEREKKRKELNEILEDIWSGLPTGSSGVAQRSDVEGVIPEVENVFEDRSIPYAGHDFEGIVEIMDKNGSGTISKTEFCQCILVIAEGVRPISIIEIHSETLECLAQVIQIKDDVGKCLRHLEATPRSAPKTVVSQELATHFGPDQHLELRECMSQLLGLREDVDKCLSYLEGTATAQIPSGVCAAKPPWFSTAADWEATVADLKVPPVHLEAERLQRHGHALKVPACLQRTPKYQNHAASAAHLDALEAVLFEALENAFASKLEAERAKLEAEVGSMAARLACRIRALPDGQKQRQPPLERWPPLEVVSGAQSGPYAAPEQTHLREATPQSNGVWEPDDTWPAAASEIRHVLPTDDVK